MEGLKLEATKDEQDFKNLFRKLARVKSIVGILYLFDPVVSREYGNNIALGH